MLEIKCKRQNSEPTKLVKKNAWAIVRDVEDKIYAKKGCLLNLWDKRHLNLNFLEFPAPFYVKILCFKAPKCIEVGYYANLRKFPGVYKHSPRKFAIYHKF